MSLSLSLFLSPCSSVFRSLLDLPFFTPTHQCLIHTRVFLLCSQPIFTVFFVLVCLFLYPLRHHISCSLPHLPYFPFRFHCLSPGKCVCTKSQHQIDPVMLRRSITQGVSRFTQQTVMDVFCSTYSFHMLVFFLLLTQSFFLSPTVATIPSWSEIWSDRLSLHLPLHR